MTSNQDLGIKGHLLKRPHQSVRPIHGILTWSTVKALLGSAVLRRYVVLLFVVPIALKAIEKVPSSVSLPFLGDIVLTLELPFSIIVLYFGVLAIFVGGIVYRLFCPDIIKDFDSFSGFTAQGHGIPYCLAGLASIREEKSSDKAGFDDAIAKLTNYETPDDVASHPLSKWATALIESDSSFKVEQRDLAAALFHRLRDLEQTNNAYQSLIAACGFSAVGVGLIGYVFIENIWFVIRSLL